jgi:hypothetical protein
VNREINIEIAVEINILKEENSHNSHWKVSKREKTR